jgi:hypothetical protein
MLVSRVIESIADEVEHRLRGLNSDLDGHPIRAYRLAWDDDFDECVVWVLYGLPEPDGDTWSLAVTDHFCERTNGVLVDDVAFVYCSFRTD